MTLTQSPVVAFSELSKHSKDVANMVERAQRVHVSRRDGGDLILTTELHDRQRTEAVEIATGLLSALMTSEDGVRAVRKVLPTVFPWVRHLNEEELEEFAQDLIDATRDMTELDVPANLHRILVGWRATARILADPELAAEAMRPIPEGDFGEVQVP
jgi:hypothetical protein